MDADSWWVREWHGATTVHPVGLSVVLLLGLACIALPRRFAAIPFLIMACFIPSAQRIVVLGLDFDYLRILTLCGWVRIISRREFAAFTPLLLDWLLLAYIATMLVTYAIQQMSFQALLTRLGYSYAAVGMYFYFRCVVRDRSDIARIGLWLGILSLPVALAFSIEYMTGRNFFSVFGGVPEITHIRHGRMRCQGAFSHPILAGMFFATSLPLLIAALSQSMRSALFIVAPLLAVVTCVVLTASSTPVMGLIFVIVGLAMWPVRQHLGYVRVAIVLSILGLSLVMKAPVYHLIARINIVGGSTSWHRYNLMHQFFTHPGDWLFVGTRSTATWGVSDITNQFVLEGVRGGLPTLSLFIAIIVVGFVYIGRCCRLSNYNRKIEFLYYALGVSLFVHITGFIGVSYFGQIIMLWYLCLALIGSSMDICRRTASRANRANRDAPRPSNNATLASASARNT